jgi:hypothetical protein
MPDITDQILNEYNNPYAEPLPPSTQEILHYADLLISEGNQLDFEWAHSEIKLHTLNWVRVGLVAYRVRLYRLYQNQYQRFQDYCEQALGRKLWQIKELIKASSVVIELARAGFEILPNCISQAMKLYRYLDSGELIEKWQQVLDSVPAHSITGMKIDESLGHDLPKKARLHIPRELRDRLSEIALRHETTVEEILADVVEQYDRVEEEDDEDEVSEVSKHKMEVWDTDLETLIAEYEIQQFLWCSLVKLSRRKSSVNRSQFSWLREFRAITA